MPAQVVVVRRSRRSLFALPRALPDLVRSLRAARFRSAPPASARVASSTDADRSPTQTAFPRLVPVDGPGHRCSGCGRCVEVCPSACLVVDVDAGGSDAGAGEDTPSSPVRGFTLAIGACIGCGDCVDVCPERALEMSPGRSGGLALEASRAGPGGLALEASRAGPGRLALEARGPISVELLAATE